MGKISKASALLLTIIIAISCLALLTTKPADAQTIPKPSVPEFTISYVDRSYDTPLVTRTTTDPYTGKQVTETSGGEHIENRTLDVVIKNQQFPQITLSNGSVVQLFYYIRYKGHFENWSQSTVNGYNVRASAAISEVTVVTFVIGTDGLTIPNDGSVDFQVEALAAIDNIYHFGNTDYHIDFTASNESDWSSIQTLHLADGSVSTSSSPNSTINTTPALIPQLSAPELLAIILAPLLLSMFTVFLIIKYRRVNHE
jgi:hypothetical protein